MFIFKTEVAGKGAGAALRLGLFRERHSGVRVPWNASSSAFVLTVQTPPPPPRASRCCFFPEALVDLMSLLVRLCPSVCENSHFAVLLGAYGASLSVLGEGTGHGGCGSGRVWGPGNVIQGSMALGGVGTGGVRLGA